MDIDEIISIAYIYIIYPLNYDVNNINTRQFYIGSTENIEISKNTFYKNLYNTSSLKTIMRMRKYMSSIKDINIKNDKEKSECDKFWQFKPIFIGYNCCTKSLLKSLEGLYIYYYYSILNTEENSFDPGHISELEHKYFEYLGICEHLSKCYAKFKYNDLQYDVNPYNLLSNDISEKAFLDIYRDICDRISIPKFKTVIDLTYQFIKQKKVDEFYNEFLEFEVIEKEDYESRKPIINNKLAPIPPNNKSNDNIYFIELEKNKTYKCYYCDKTYTNVNSWLCEHLDKKHDVIISVKKARTFIK